MNWYYAEGGQQRGPVNETELAGLVASGVIQAQTLVWNEKLPNWLPWAQVAPAAEPMTGDSARPGNERPAVTAAVAAAEGPAGNHVRCTQCGQMFPPDDTVELGGRRVCASCKPLLLQRLQEGAALPAATAVGTGGAVGTLSPEEWLERDYSIDATGAVSEAWDLLFRRPAVVLLGCILLWGAFIGASAPLAVLGIIPLVGALASALISSFLAPLLEAGQANLFLRERRGLPNEVSSGFAFFGPRFWSVALTHLPHAIFAVSLQVVLLTMGLGFGFTAPMWARGQGANFAWPVLAIPMALGGLVMGLGMLFLYTCFRYAPILALDKGYSWTDSLRLSWRFVLKHFWQNFWLLFLSGLVMLAGLILCCVGSVISYPLAYGMTGVVYDRWFRDLAPAARP